MDRRFHELLHQFGGRISQRAKSAHARLREADRLNPERKLLLRRLAAGISLLGFSVILGLAAREESREKALEDWKRNHLPSEALWRSTLESRGFASPASRTQENVVLRTLPGRWDRPGEAWLASPPARGANPTRWIALLLPEEGSESAEGSPRLLLFRQAPCGGEEKTAQSVRKKQAARAAPRLITSSPIGASKRAGQAPAPAAKDWKPLGFGWDALQNFVREDQTAPLQKTLCAQGSAGGKSMHLPTAGGSMGFYDPRALRY